MSYPNTLSSEFYSSVFGWEIEPRPAGVFHRVVPGQNFQVDDGSQGPNTLVLWTKVGGDRQIPDGWTGE